MEETLPVSSEEFDPPIKAFCWDIEAGHAGNLTIDDDEWLLRLYSRDVIPLSSQRRRVLQLESGVYATLLDCVDGGDAGYAGPHHRTLERRTIPNIVALGDKPWPPSGVVKRISFTFSGAREAIYFNRHLRARKLRAPTILTVRVDGVRITVGTSVSHRRGIAKEEIVSTPRVTIELDEGVPIDGVREIAHQVLTFFNLSVGKSCQPFDLRINELTVAEFNELRSEDRGRNPSYTLRYQYRRGSFAGQIHHSAPIFTFRNAEQRKRTKIALQRWMDRRKEWSNTYALAFHYIHDRDYIDVHRLLRAMAWFESIPTYAGRPRLTAPQIKKIKQGANEAAKKAKVQIPASRISEVINQLQYEPLNSRLSRAIAKIRKRFGVNIVPDTIEADCKVAKGLRDKAAHGGFSGDDFDALHRGIYALELVCVLSMVADLRSDPKNGSMNPLLLYRLIQQ